MAHLLEELEDVCLTFLKIVHSSASEVEELRVDLTAEEGFVEEVKLSRLPSGEVLMSSRVKLEASQDEDCCVELLAVCVRIFYRTKLTRACEEELKLFLP